jgi:hypothetical protein
VAYEWTGALASPARSQSGGAAAMPAGNMPAAEVEVQVRKPLARSPAGHAEH